MQINLGTPPLNGQRVRSDLARQEAEFIHPFDRCYRRTPKPFLARLRKIPCGFTINRGGPAPGAYGCGYNDSRVKNV